MIHALNDSDAKHGALLTVVAGLNITAALASGAFGALAMVDPSTLVGSPVASDPATGFFVDMYGIRALVLSAGIVAASLTIRRAPIVAALVFAGAGLVQLGDVVIAAHFGTAGVVGASIAAAVHVGSAGLLLARIRRSR